MFQDEAGFGRINKPKYCWCQEGIRPSVPCHHIREYRYAYGAVEPLTGDGYFLVMPYCNTVCMNIFLKKLSERFSDDIILLCCDGAAWHKSGGLELPENIILFHIPPYTPEMNPIEQIWKEIRKRGFRNEVFATLEKVVDRLCDTICSLSNNAISRATPRNSARSLSQNFCPNSKFRKWRNTVCISHFRNCGSGAKRRLRLAGAIVRCCL